VESSDVIVSLLFHPQGCARSPRAHSELATCYAERKACTEEAIRNVTCSGKFSSDRTIREYAKQIWNLEVSPVFLEWSASSAAPEAPARWYVTDFVWAD